MLLRLAVGGVKGYSCDSATFYLCAGEVLSCGRAACRVFCIFLEMRSPFNEPIGEYLILKGHLKSVLQPELQHKSDASPVTEGNGLFELKIINLDLGGLINSEIVNFGLVEGRKRAIALDYKSKDSIIKRIVFEFDETGIWVDDHG